MCSVVKKVLCGRKLMCYKIVNLDDTLPNEEYILVTGKVLSPDKIPLSNAAIKIFLIDEKYSPAKKKYIGVTFSNEKGIYGISIPRFLGVSYEFKAYGSI